MKIMNLNFPSFEKLKEYGYSYIKTMFSEGLVMELGIIENPENRHQARIYGGIAVIDKNRKDFPGRMPYLIDGIRVASAYGDYHSKEVEWSYKHVTEELQKAFEAWVSRFLE